MAEKSVLTIATGKQLYINMAIALARSFYIWNKNNGIDFYIATDQEKLIPDDVLAYARIISLTPKQFGEGFSTKLHLDKMAVTGKTLFIDSDCLVVGDLRFIFEKFEGKSVSVVGSYISNGEWFGDVKSVCNKFGINQMLKFNGGLYYLEKGETASLVYEKARELEPLYDEIGFVRLRNKPNDEVLMSLAMEIMKQTPLEEDGSILGELVNFQSGITIDTFEGKCVLYNKPSHKKYQPSWPFEKGEPKIVHFLGDNTTKYPYIREEKILREVFVKKRKINVARIITFMTLSLPVQGKELLKLIFRPIYHFAFGFRKVTISERL